MEWEKKTIFDRLAVFNLSFIAVSFRGITIHNARTLFYSSHIRLCTNNFIYKWMHHNCAKSDPEGHAMYRIKWTPQTCFQSLQGSYFSSICSRFQGSSLISKIGHTFTICYCGRRGVICLFPLGLQRVIATFPNAVKGVMFCVDSQSLMLNNCEITQKLM